MVMREIAAPGDAVSDGLRCVMVMKAIAVPKVSVRRRLVVTISARRDAHSPAHRCARVTREIAALRDSAPRLLVVTADRRTVRARKAMATTWRPGQPPGWWRPARPALVMTTRSNDDEALPGVRRDRLPGAPAGIVPCSLDRATTPPKQPASRRASGGVFVSAAPIKRPAGG